MAEILRISESDLRAFLKRGKTATFAGEGPRIKRRFIRTYKFNRGRWSYEDRYTGNLLDTGIEIVRFRDFPVWTMVYRGGMLPDSRNLSKETFSFLKECLRLSPEEIPVRGPRQHSREQWEYLNDVQGKITEFSGHERILLNGKEVYTRNYLGGLVFDKKYTIVLMSSRS